MPGGENCAIYGCSVDRREKFQGLSIFKLPGLSGQQNGVTDEEQIGWRKNFLSKVTRNRVVDAVLQKKIDTDKLYVCENHFNPSDIIRGK